MKISELKSQLEQISHNLYLPQPKVIKEGISFIKMRIRVKSEVTIELYFNEETQTLTSALLVKDERIFGINGYPKSGMWHVHSLDKIYEHEEIALMELEKILEEYATVLRKLDPNTF